MTICPHQIKRFTVYENRSQGCKQSYITNCLPAQWSVTLSFSITVLSSEYRSGVYGCHRKGLSIFNLARYEEPHRPTNEKNLVGRLHFTVFINHPGTAAPSGDIDLHFWYVFLHDNSSLFFNYRIMWRKLRHRQLHPLHNAWWCEADRQ